MTRKTSHTPWKTDKTKILHGMVNLSRQNAPSWAQTIASLNGKPIASEGYDISEIFRDVLNVPNPADRDNTYLKLVLSALVESGDLGIYNDKYYYPKGKAILTLEEIEANRRRERHASIREWCLIILTACIAFITGCDVFLGSVDKRDSHSACDVIQDHRSNGGDDGAQLDVRRRVAVL